MNGNEEKPAWRQALGRLGYLGASALAEVPETLGALAGGFGALRSMTRASPRGASPGPLANYEAVSQSMPLVPEAQALRRSAADYAVRQGVPRGDLIMGELLAPDLMPGPLGDLAAIKMLHASPHRFRRFDMSKMGSGQGAAAYGRGAYFSHPDAPAVHKSYFEEFDDYDLFIGGEKQSMLWDPADDRVIALRKLGDAMQRHGGDAAAAGREVRQRLLDDIGTPFEPDPERLRKQIDIVDDALRRGAEIRGGAQSYAVDIDVEPEDLLDYDAPLSQQSPAIQQMLLRLRDTAQQGIDEGVLAVPGKQALLRDALDPLEWDATTGATVLNLLEDGEEALREAGIPGLRYADFGSRGGQGGTYNVVMFPGTEDLIGEMQPGPLSSQMPKGGLAE